MPPPPGSRQSSWESTLLVTELAELEAGGNTYTNEIKEEKREEANEKEERVRANTSSASLKSKHETNGGATQTEPGSEFVVWWDEPHDQDPENPMNWSSTRKWFNICIISIISFLV